VTPDPSDLVADAIENRLAQIGLHGANVLRLERIEPTEDVKDGLLNQIAGIEGPSRGRRQLTVRPPLQLRHTPLKQRFSRLSIAAPGPYHELDRRFVADERRILRGIGWLWLRAHVLRAGCNDSGETRAFM